MLVEEGTTLSESLSSDVNESPNFPVLLMMYLRLLYTGIVTTKSYDYNKNACMQLLMRLTKHIRLYVSCFCWNLHKLHHLTDIVCVRVTFTIVMIIYFPVLNELIFLC